MTNENSDITITVSLNLPASVFQIVEAQANKEKVSHTAIIRHAIELKKYIDDIIDGGGKLLIQRNKEEVKEVVFK